MTGAVLEKRRTGSWELRGQVLGERLRSAGDCRKEGDERGSDHMRLQARLCCCEEGGRLPCIGWNDYSKLNYIVFAFFCSETIMFLHEIFHQGLKARIANWPTLILGKCML